MLVNCKCKKCGETGKIDTEDMTREEVQVWLDKETQGFECFGHHMEFGKRSNYWTIDWDTLTEGRGPSEEEFFRTINQKHDVVFDTTQLQEKYIVLGFQEGVCYAKERDTLKEISLEYINSPSGKRYYFIRR